MAYDAWRIWGVQFGATLVQGWTSIQSAAGVTVDSPDMDGETVRRVAAALQSAPELTLTGHDISEVLSEVGLEGLDLASVGAGGVKVWFAKWGAVGPADNGHMAVSMAAGAAVVDRVSARQGGHAEVTLRLMPRGADGLTHPLTITTNETTLPTAQETWAGLWTLGPVAVNGAADEGVQSWSLEMNWTDGRRDFAGGGPYPTVVSVRGAHPRISVETRDALRFPGIAGAAVAQGATASDLYLRRHTGGVVDADATTVHMRFRVAAGVWHRDSLGGGGDAAVASYTAEVVAGAADAVQVDEDVAIA